MMCVASRGAGHSRNTCPEKALFLVFGPEVGAEPEGPSPGSFYCEQHGRAVVEELWEKCQEAWWLAPIDKYGRVVEGGTRIYAKGAPQP